MFNKNPFIYAPTEKNDMITLLLIMLLNTSRELSKALKDIDVFSGR